MEVHSVQEGGGCAVDEQWDRAGDGMMQTRSRTARGYKKVWEQR